MCWIDRWLTFALAATIMGVPMLAPATTYSLAPGQVAIGEIGTYVTTSKDTLLDVARDRDLGYTQLMVANRGVNPWLPGDGKKIILPGRYLLPGGPRLGIVLNLSQQRVYYFPAGGKTVETYPIGAGVVGWITPIGVTRVVSKEVNPGWSPPPSIRRQRPELPTYIPPGPDNPMGLFAMGLGWRGFYLHGTNKPYGVGRNVSHGCIHFYPEDIEKLFREVALGTRVRVIDDEVSATWAGDRLYVAVYPNKEQTDQIDIEESMTPMLPDNLLDKVEEVAADRTDRVDWNLVRRLGVERTGIPTEVAHTGDAIASSGDGTEDMSVVEHVIQTFRAR